MVVASWRIASNCALPGLLVPVQHRMVVDETVFLQRMGAAWFQAVSSNVQMGLIVSVQRQVAVAARASLLWQDVVPLSVVRVSVLRVSLVQVSCRIVVEELVRPTMRQQGVERCLPVSRSARQVLSALISCQEVVAGCVCR